MTDNLLKQWQVTPAEIAEILDQNPSLRGFMLGYVAEYKLQSIWFSSPRVDKARKPDDHDRAEKCDLVVTYKGEDFRVEVKSLQTRSVRETEKGMIGRFQCDASDRRGVVLPNGKVVHTTCLRADEFDVAVVNLFAFTGQWDFAFIRNRDLPRSEYKKYTKYQRKHLLKSIVSVTWPLEKPFTDEPFSLFEEIIGERRR